MHQNIELPVDFELTNQNKVRTTSGLVLILAIIIVITGSWLAAALLVVDFLMRAFNYSKYSLLSGVSAAIVDLFGIDTIPVNQLPKIVSARIGAVSSIIILLLVVADFTIAAKVTAGILAILASLEFFTGFCAGCYIHTLFSKVFITKKSLQRNA